MSNNNSFDELDGMNFEDHTNFTFDNEDYDLISDYNTMMEEVENQSPMDMLADFADQDINFYETIDELEFDYEEDISSDLINKGKRSYNKMKSDGNDFEKEFSKELTMYYDTLDEINKFSKKLDKKFDAIDGSKAKGTSKYLNDLIVSILNAKNSKMTALDKISNLKKTMIELKMKQDKETGANKQEDTSLESSANQYFRQIMTVGRGNFIDMLESDSTITGCTGNDDLEYSSTMSDAQIELNDKIAERLSAEANGRSIEGDKYIAYENMKIEQVVKYSVSDNNWEVIAVDEFGQQVIDFPVPTRKELGKVKFSTDNRFMTDQFGRSYKVIEKYESTDV